mgnify:CR=1 FL=1
MDAVELKAMHLLSPGFHTRLCLFPCLFAALLGCAPRYLRPPPAPEPVAGPAPRPLTPPAEGEGTVRFDVTEGSAHVELVTRMPPAQVVEYLHNYAHADSFTAQPLCQTPCTVNLPRGYHRVQFSNHAEPLRWESSGYIRVGDRPTMVRHTLGQFRESPAATALLEITGVLGVSFFAFGSITAAVGTDEDGRDIRPTGLSLMAVGGVLALGAWLGLWLARPTVQPGATTQWTP